jgi:hypothetical protein
MHLEKKAINAAGASNFGSSSFCMPYGGFALPCNRRQYYALVSFLLCGNTKNARQSAAANVRAFTSRGKAVAHQSVVKRALCWAKAKVRVEIAIAL